jgi:dihydrofolate reductase
MGRNTYFSIPEKYRPLSNRLNVILSKNKKLKEILPQEVLVYETLDEALNYLKFNESIENVFIIGGSQVYNEAIKDNRCSRIYLTRIYEEFDCDVYFPLIPEDKFILLCQKEMQEENKDLHFQFSIYTRK